MDMCTQEEMAPVEGSTLVYSEGTEVAIFFILEENGGYSVCWAFGDRSRVPMGDSIVRYLFVDSLPEALDILAGLEKIANEALGL